MIKYLLMEVVYSYMFNAVVLFHYRHQCKCTEFPTVPPGRSEQVEPGPGNSSCDREGISVPVLCWGFDTVREHQQLEGVWPSLCAILQATFQIHWYVPSLSSPIILTVSCMQHSAKLMLVLHRCTQQ